MFDANKTEVFSQTDVNSNVKKKCRNRNDRKSFINLIINFKTINEIS
ncbi:hypothetical protein SAMN05444372_1078 [Flavobacterium micromati]|uniref:Uncharacterized protein n=1 Tax=Flavobacterium micromati TaxID=229205 RepID=A0A1M5KNG7_9FLAO|nr:hypothetical protein SAMN05444372_1078 [Flavobacterium micromati]